MAESSGPSVPALVGGGSGIAVVLAVLLGIVLRLRRNGAHARSADQGTTEERHGIEEDPGYASEYGMEEAAAIP
jgi:hypothetical protein